MDMVVLGFKSLGIFASGLIVVPLVHALRSCGIRAFRALNPKPSIFPADQQSLGSKKGLLGWMALGVQGLGCFWVFGASGLCFFWGVYYGFWRLRAGFRDERVGEWGFHKCPLVW